MTFGYTSYNEKPEMEGQTSARYNEDRVRQFQFFSNELGEDHKRRVILLDGAAGKYFGVWLHDHYAQSTGTSVQEICLVQNKHADGTPLAARCPACEHAYTDQRGQEKTWRPVYCGCFTVLEMGHVKRERRADNQIGDVIVPIRWTNKKGKSGEYSYQRKMLILKYGNETYPGMLQNLSSLVCSTFVTEDPHFQGVVCDVKRETKLSEKSGNSWQVVMHNNQPVQLRPDQFLPYAQKTGAPPDLDPRAVDPLDFSAIWVPKAVEELERIVLVATAKPQVAGAGYGGSPTLAEDRRAVEASIPSAELSGEDDDLPF